MCKKYDTKVKVGLIERAFFILFMNKQNKNEHARFDAEWRSIT